MTLQNRSAAYSQVSASRAPDMGSVTRQTWLCEGLHLYHTYSQKRAWIYTRTVCFQQFKICGQIHIELLDIGISSFCWSFLLVPFIIQITPALPWWSWMQDGVGGMGSGEEQLRYLQDSSNNVKRSGFHMQSAIVQLLPPLLSSQNNPHLAKLNPSSILNKHNTAYMDHSNCATFAILCESFFMHTNPT